MSVTSAQAISLLENVLFESSTQAKANAASWVSLSTLNPAYSTVTALASAMASTPEAGIVEQVIRYYEGALGRSPTGTEVAYYTNIVENGNTAAGIPALTAAQISAGAVPQTTWNAIAGFFAASPEFAFASAGSNTVTLLYLNILGRSPSASEVQFYQNLLATGTTVSTLVQYFTTSPEYQTKVNGQIQAGISAYGSGVANGGAATGGVVSITANQPTPVTYTLTTGVDTIVANAPVNIITGTLSGTKATLTTLDSITASGSTTLNLAATAAFTKFPAVTIKGVQTVNITAAATFTGDTHTWTGTTSVSVNDVSAKAVKLTAAAATVNITEVAGKTANVTDGSSSANVITTIGLSGIKTGASTLTGAAIATLNLTNVSTGAAGTLTIVNTAGAGKGGTLSLNVTHAGSTKHGALTIKDSKAAYAAVAINTTGASDLILTGSTKAKTVTAGGTGALTLSIAGDANLTGATITGAGGVTISDATSANLKTVNASASTGANTVTLSGTGATYTGGSGANHVIVKAVPAVAINGGTGTSNTIDLGIAGLDLSTVTKTAMANATNFQSIEFSGTLKDGKTLNVANLSSGITGVVLNAAATAAVAGLTVTNAAATTTVTILHNVTDAISIKQATAGALSLTLGSTTGVGGLTAGKAVTAVNATSVSIASLGTTSAAANALNLNAGSATSLVLTGTDGLTLTGSTLTKVAAVDATGLTGKLTLTTSVTSGVTVKLGSGAAVLVGSAVAGKTDTFTGGNGVVSITEAHGNNSVTLGDGKADVLALGDGNNTVVLGNGAGDSVTVTSGNNTITVGNGAADIVSVGAGTNTVTLGTGAGDTVTFTAAGKGSGIFTTVTGATTGDILNVNAVHAIANAASSALGNALSSAVQDYQTFLNDAVASKVAGTVSWFQFGGNTFVVEEVGTTGSFVAGTDLVIQLTGLHNLSKSTVDATQHFITL